MLSLPHNRSFSRRRTISTSKSQATSDVTSPRQPWEEWDLDPRFFKALTRWTLKNPETSLDNVLQKVNRIIDDSDKLLALVPDSPFPARGLVGALIHLIRLGVVCNLYSVNTCVVILCHTGYFQSQKGSTAVFERNS